MTNNDILRRLRYVLDFDNAKMIETFAMADMSVKRGRIAAWLRKEDEESYLECDDRTLAVFLNGLINTKRGKKDGPQPEPEESLTNNIILRKLKIAFNLESDDIIAILLLSDFVLSAAELGSFFRKPGHRNYRACKSQVLRNFLMGLQIKFRDQEKKRPNSVWPSGD
ncbi:MAG: DUF1456 family protein [Pseudomonadales bacterium]